MSKGTRINGGLNCSLFGSSLFRIIFISLYSVIVVGCTSEPPSSRPNMSLPIYTAGDSTRGEVLYDENCLQCHKRKIGNNKKGPQLLGIYGASAASLKDYKYSEAMRNSGWVWSAEQLDTYIADPIAVMPDTRMLSDPIPNAVDRQDIIAYLSTLGRSSPPTPDAGM